MRKSLFVPVIVSTVILAILIVSSFTHDNIFIPALIRTGPIMHTPGEYDGPRQNMPTLDPDLVAEGKLLYAKYCAACHGANLEGQSNWKTRLPNGQLPAPPHDDSGHTWHHGDSLLYKVIFEGGNGFQTAKQTGMPAFASVIDGRDALAIISYIKSRWSLENQLFQWEMTQLGH
jgi:mono/diheme cytochrome c family protein